jgi:putative hydrolase of the HAD superfamily
MTVRAVFLDVDDTLVDYQTAARAAFENAIGSLDRYDEFHNLDHYERFLTGEFDFQTFRDTRMADFLARVGMTDEVARAAEIERRRFDGLAAHYTLFDDVHWCLDLLRARELRIGLITNNEGAHQRAKLATVGLDRLVDVIVISQEIGVAKPDARIFAHACELVGVRADEAIHVGDNPYADAEGAHLAGLRAVWLDRRAEHDGAERPYAVIRGLHELADHV